RALIGQERLLMVADGLLGPLSRGRRLALLQTPQGLGEHLGLAEKVVVHDLFDLLLRELRLVGAHDGPGAERRSDDTEDEREGDESGVSHDARSIAPAGTPRREAPAAPRPDRRAPRGTGPPARRRARDGSRARRGRRRWPPPGRY